MLTPSIPKRFRFTINRLFVAGRKIAGAEALARWQQPMHFFIAGYFIPLADRPGYHAADGRYRQEIYRSRSWLRQRPEVHISISLSVFVMTRPHPTGGVRPLPADRCWYNSRPKSPSAGLSARETTMPVIAHYRQAGHRISIDDLHSYPAWAICRNWTSDARKSIDLLSDALASNRLLTPHIIRNDKALNLATVTEGWSRKPARLCANMAFSTPGGFTAKRCQKAVHSVGKGIALYAWRRVLSRNVRGRYFGWDLITCITVSPLALRLIRLFHRW